MPPLDMASFFAQEHKYSPDIISRPHQQHYGRYEEPEMPDHIKDRIELEEFGMLFGQGREPNRWDDHGLGDGQFSYEERSRWYRDPYSPSYHGYHGDYYPDEEWDYTYPHFFNLATNEDSA